jgi:hypothetical protein
MILALLKMKGHMKEWNAYKHSISTYLDDYQGGKATKIHYLTKQACPKLYLIFFKIALVQGLEAT